MHLGHDDIEDTFGGILVSTETKSTSIEQYCALERCNSWEFLSLLVATLHKE